MNISKIIISGNASPELPERVLRIVRHRGFSILEFNCSRTDVGFSFELTLSSDRDINNLFSQLQKVINISHCEIAAV